MMLHRSNVFAVCLGRLSVPSLARAQDAKPLGERLYDVVAAQQPMPTPGRWRFG